MSNLKRQLKARQDGAWARVHWGLAAAVQPHEMEVVQGRLIVADPKVSSPFCCSHAFPPKNKASSTFCCGHALPPEKESQPWRVKNQNNKKQHWGPGCCCAAS